jgi:hypothetical protein
MHQSIRGWLHHLQMALYQSLSGFRRLQGAPALLQCLDYRQN